MAISLKLILLGGIFVLGSIGLFALEPLIFYAFAVVGIGLVLTFIGLLLKDKENNDMKTKLFLFGIICILASVGMFHLGELIFIASAFLAVGGLLSIIGLFVKKGK